MVSGKWQAPKSKQIRSGEGAYVIVGIPRQARRLWKYRIERKPQEPSSSTQFAHFFHLKPPFLLLPSSILSPSLSWIHNSHVFISFRSENGTRPFRPRGLVCKQCGHELCIERQDYAERDCDFVRCRSSHGMSPHLRSVVSVQDAPPPSCSCPAPASFGFLRGPHQPSRLRLFSDARSRRFYSEFASGVRVLLQDPHGYVWMRRVPIWVWGEREGSSSSQV